MRTTLLPPPNSSLAKRQSFRPRSVRTRCVARYLKIKKSRKSRTSFPQVCLCDTENGRRHRRSKVCKVERKLSLESISVPILWQWRPRDLFQLQTESYQALETIEL